MVSPEHQGGRFPAMVKCITAFLSLLSGYLETVRLSRIPGMVDSIRQGMAEPLEDCAPYDPKEPW